VRIGGRCTRWGEKSIYELHALKEVYSSLEKEEELTQVLIVRGEKRDPEVAEFLRYVGVGRETPLNLPIEEVKRRYLKAVKQSERGYYRRKLEAEARLAWTRKEQKKLYDWLRAHP